MFFPLKFFKRSCRSKVGRYIVPFFSLPQAVSRKRPQQIFFFLCVASRLKVLDKAMIRLNCLATPQLWSSSVNLLPPSNHSKGMISQANQIKASYLLSQSVECCCFLNQSDENQNQVPAVCNSPRASIIHFPLLALLTRDTTKGPFTEAIFVAQLNAIFVALKL